MHKPWIPSAIIGVDEEEWVNQKVALKLDLGHRALSQLLRRLRKEE